MVITARRIVSISDVKYVLQKYKDKDVDNKLNDLINLPQHRSKAPPPPTGSISIHAAGIKYHIPPATIQKWVRKGVIPVIKHTLNSTYIDENTIIKLSKLDRKERHILIENYNK